MPRHCELLLDTQNKYSCKGPLEDIWPDFVLKPELASMLDLTSSKLDQAAHGLGHASFERFPRVTPPVPTKRQEETPL